MKNKEKLIKKFELIRRKVKNKLTSKKINEEIKQKRKNTLKWI